DAAANLGKRQRQARRQGSAEKGREAGARPGQGKEGRIVAWRRFSLAAAPVTAVSPKQAEVEIAAGAAGLVVAERWDHKQDDDQRHGKCRPWVARDKRCELAASQQQLLHDAWLT